jgi:hypothetical protein
MLARRDRWPTTTFESASPLTNDRATIFERLETMILRGGPADSGVLELSSAPYGVYTRAIFDI